MCNCIEKINEKLREDSDDEFASLNTNMGIKGNKLQETIAITYQCRTKKKDGTMSDKKKTFTISGAFCPFCGEVTE